ncbi:hypothetical protein [Aeropyrum camini]|uniref:hypothetical protein n=1 Tax=Aeropyrum camini TaxID=229980 RepID=UPI000788F3F7|nr:hypothetical protein [Aeropyrum camini]
MAETLLPGSTVRIGDALCRVSLPIVAGVESSCLLVAGVLRVTSGLVKGEAYEHVSRLYRRGLEPSWRASRLSRILIASTRGPLPMQPSMEALFCIAGVGTLRYQDSTVLGSS